MALDTMLQKRSIFRRACSFSARSASSLRYEINSFFATVHIHVLTLPFSGSNQADAS